MSEEVKEKQENKRKISFMSEGILIGGLTAVGYAIAYYYEKGYKGYFLMPVDYIELNPTMIIRVIGLTLVIGIFLFAFIDLISIYLNQLKSLNSAVSSIIDNITGLGISYFFFMMLIGLNEQSFFMFLLFLAVISLINFGMPLLTHRKTKGYRNKLEAAVKMEEERNSNSLKGLLYSIRQRLGYKNFRLALYLLLIAATIPNFSLLGKTNANAQTKFMIVEGNPKYIVVGTYKDYAVVAELDTIKKEVIPNYKLNRNEKFIAKLYDVGKLKVAEPETLK
ncbi:MULTISPECIES: hypothetical protein [Paenibacillus]|uniref:hypothetical protein n=1 Tax=Paenibacillus TaxID=44249 RepID=UPI001143A6BC|nr:hypothetical protein [Paenibacillus lautus]